MIVRRWATREVIEALEGQLLEQTATVVDVSVVAQGASSIIGMTRRGFNPQANASAHVLKEIGPQSWDYKT